MKNNSLYLRLLKYIDIVLSYRLNTLLFKTWYVIQTKTRILKIKFPPYEKNANYSLENFSVNSRFFFKDRSELDFPKNRNKILKSRFRNVINGYFPFFSSKYLYVGKDIDWLTNQLTGYKYSINKHFSRINDFSNVEGDIKYVWELSRFIWVYDIIRYDYHFKKDNSDFVFAKINDWIKVNRPNYGPNYKCSQEISIRVLNWIFALYFYKNSISLTEKYFISIINSINTQVHHIYKNINFSRKIVRNNHSITETITIYIVGLLFPDLPSAKKWKQKGKKWFEQEISYQIYEDGSYLQFSHNYHRLVLQLLTWAICLSEKNNVKLSKDVYLKSKKSLKFLIDHQDIKTGHLPNYGMNDGTLLFPLSNTDYRDYRPQIQALASILNINTYNIIFEDQFWYGKKYNTKPDKFFSSKKGVFKYTNGGFFGFRDNALTTISCATYKNRPAQSDALNLDIWLDGINIIRDPGSYGYNISCKLAKFFFGTIGHNTASLSEENQMLKGARFLWYFWTKSDYTYINENSNYFIFKGKIVGYRQIGKHITHQRIVIKRKNKLKWIVKDVFDKTNGYPVIQRWNINPLYKEKINVTSFNSNKIKLQPIIKRGWYSESYGLIERCEQLQFSTESNYIKTIIEVI